MKPRFVAAATLTLAFVSTGAATVRPPNILWLSTEDISPHLACYGDPHALTPQLDQLAAEGTLYTRAFATAGVCAPSRSAIISGLYQSSLGTQHMRSQVRVPEGVELFPSYLRRAGYYTANNEKQDYQIDESDPALARAWDDSSRQAHWRNRPDPGQPFFAVFNYGGTHESGIANDAKYRRITAKLPPGHRQDPAALTTLPPYYPDTPVSREDWKRNYELISTLDAWAGDLIQQLKDDGLYENTIIFFWSDHGVGLPRAKRWLYDSGTRVPLIVRVPERYRPSGKTIPGATDGRLISTLDLAPTVLALAGVPLPAHFQGQPFLGSQSTVPRDYVYAARDRMDERYDIIRTVRDQRFRYLRNYKPFKTYYQYMNTAEEGATMAELRRLHEAGRLDPVTGFYFSPAKPVEELYDTEVDPHEIHNLAGDPRYASVLERLRAAHLQWVVDTRDLGLIPEPLLDLRDEQPGGRYGTLRQKDGPAFVSRLSAVARQASEGPEALPALLAALRDPQPAIRYWAATGIGNLGAPAAYPARDAVTAALADESPVVRIAAARALCHLGRPEKALPALTAELDRGRQWERLHAAIVLDEIGEMSRPVLAEMHAALQPREELFQRGKYVVRVINHALNQLEGTDRAVR